MSTNSSNKKEPPRLWGQSPSLQMDKQAQGEKGLSLDPKHPGSQVLLPISLCDPRGRGRGTLSLSGPWLSNLQVLVECAGSGG